MAVTMQVLSDPSSVEGALSGIRRRALELLVEPRSATDVASEMGLTRQKVNYHLRRLEALGLVEEVGHRQRRGFVETVFQRVGEIVVDPKVVDARRVAASTRDGASVEGLISTAATAVSEVSGMWRDAEAAGQRLATLSVSADVHFASPREMRRFTAELAELIARFDRPTAAGAMRYRTTALAYPAPFEEDENV